MLPSRLKQSTTTRDLAELAAFASPVFKFRRNGALAAANHVGIVTTGRGTGIVAILGVLQILPI